MEICNGAEHTVAKIGTRKRYIYRVISDFFSLKRWFFSIQNEMDIGQGMCMYKVTKTNI